MELPIFKKIIFFTKIINVRIQNLIYKQGEDPIYLYVVKSGEVTLF